MHARFWARDIRLPLKKKANILLIFFCTYTMSIVSSTTNHQQEKENY